MTVPYAEIKLINHIYIGYVRGREITKAATAQKCSAKLASYIKSQS